MHVVLVHPDIPWNTGNVGRTCVAMNTSLHLIRPLGFSLDDKWRRRAGLDYWEHLDWTVHESLRHFSRSGVAQNPIFIFSRFASQPLWTARFPRNAVLIFGSETRGLPVSLRRKYRQRAYRIPYDGPVRSLNLSTAVGVVLYEAHRQQFRRPQGA